MTKNPEPTCEQKRFALHPNEVFVAACPGAGKTRAILDRLENLLRTLPPRFGVAVLSFTQSAVEEFVSRCNDRKLHELLHHPHYCGTFDGFVRHFLVMPSGVACPVGTIRATIVDSWESLDVRVQVKGVSGQGPFLDSFDPESNSIDLSRVRDRRIRSAVERAKSKFEERAKRIREGLNNRGYLSAAEARLHALRRIRESENGFEIGKAIAARFVEIIVDEGQDCNPQDVEILRWLRQHGVRVTLLADLDQSIYEFRQGGPETLSQFANEFSELNKLPFTGNFRSSPAICALASTLRGREKSKPDDSLGAAARIQVPIRLLLYEGKVPSGAVGKRFVEILSELGIPINESIVLAHKWRTARCATGIVHSETQAGTSKVETIARAVSIYRDLGVMPRQRLQALLKVEQIILDLSGVREENEPTTRTIERNLIDQRLLRRRAATLISTLRSSIGPSESEGSCWVQELQSIASSLGTEVSSGNSVRKFFKSPGNGKWSEALLVRESASLSASSIHEAKGHEHRAVCVAIPAEGGRTEELITSWENRTALEAKRVIYVGITRAKELVVIAIPKAYASRIAKVLRDSHVPFEPLELLPGSIRKRSGRKKASQTSRDEAQGCLFKHS
jgi:ATP-dependent DNA helicase UvrD/PcrA